MTPPRAAWLLVLPTLLVLVLVALWPLARTVAVSFTDARLGSADPVRFVGLANYAGEGGILADGRFLRSAGTTLAFTAVSVVLETAIGLAIALLLHARFPGRGLVRAAVLVPWAVPTVVSARMWSWMLHDVHGVVNDLLIRLGILDAKVAWLAGDLTALAAITLVDVWKTTPFMVFLLLAGLQGIPRSLHEAAIVDGASPGRRFLSITLPLLRGPLLVALVFRTLDALRVFDVFFAMKRDLHTLATYGRLQLIDFQAEGYGSAVSTAIAAAVLAFTWLYVKLVRGEEA